MTHAELITAMRHLADEPVELIRAIADHLERMADATAEAEPYATRSIADRRKAAAILHDLATDIANDEPEPSEDEIDAMNAALLKRL